MIARHREDAPSPDDTNAGYGCGIDDDGADDDGGEGDGDGNGDGDGIGDDDDADNYDDDCAQCMMHDCGDDDNCYKRNVPAAARNIWFHWQAYLAKHPQADLIFFLTASELMECIPREK